MTDTERLDWMADERFFDGLGDVDIDEETLAVFSVDANGKWKTARKKNGKSNGAIRCALQLIKPPRRWVMLDIPPDGYMPMGWTASQFACNVVIILAILALISFLRSLR